MNIKSIQVYDPSMCCSIGVCGPEVDPKLVQFAADLKWLQERSVTVARHSLSQNPAAFVENDTVRAALTEKGESVLPLVFAGGAVLASGSYPISQPAEEGSECCGPATASTAERGNRCCG